MGRTWEYDGISVSRCQKNFTDAIKDTNQLTLSLSKRTSSRWTWPTPISLLNLGLEVRERGSQRSEALEEFDVKEILCCWLEVGRGHTARNVGGLQELKVAPGPHLAFNLVRLSRDSSYAMSELLTYRILS